MAHTTSPATCPEACARQCNSPKDAHVLTPRTLCLPWQGRLCRHDDSAGPWHGESSPPGPTQGRSWSRWWVEDGARTPGAEDGPPLDAGQGSRFHRGASGKGPTPWFILVTARRPTCPGSAGTVVGLVVGLEAAHVCRAEMGNRASRPVSGWFVPSGRIPGVALPGRTWPALGPSTGRSSLGAGSLGPPPRRSSFRSSSEGTDASHRPQHLCPAPEKVCQGQWPLESGPGTSDLPPGRV